LGASVAVASGAAKSDRGRRAKNIRARPPLSILVKRHLNIGGVLASVVGGAIHKETAQWADLVTPTSNLGQG
jgi:hypothetical protein